MPALFVGHGSPMNVIEENAWSRGFRGLGGLVMKPRAILAISAHWYVGGTFLTGDVRPKTIHDFGGFPRALYEIEYPASGSVDLARRVRGLIGESRASLSDEWGLDHGTWSVLRSMYPAADVPVVQLSIDRRLDVSKHYELARSLAELRDEGVLIFGSGNVVHNLRDAFTRMRTATPSTPDWAARFDRAVAEAVAERDTQRLLALYPGTDDGRMAHPSPDHFLPLIYAYAVTDATDRVSFPIDGFDAGSISMRSVLFGGAQGPDETSASTSA
jgi:4,5-DOPA dioxygenase extradiol